MTSPGGSLADMSPEPPAAEQQDLEPVELAYAHSVVVHDGQVLHVVVYHLPQCGDQPVVLIDGGRLDHVLLDGERQDRPLASGRGLVLVEQGKGTFDGGG